MARDDCHRNDVSSDADQTQINGYCWSDEQGDPDDMQTHQDRVKVRRKPHPLLWTFSRTVRTTEDAEKAPQSFALNMVVEDIDRWWKQAVAAGMEVVMPVEKMFWGDRYGQLRDPFGVIWSMNEPAKR